MIVYHLFSYPVCYILMQLVIYLPVFQLLTAPNEPNYFPSKSNHNQQLNQLVLGVSKHHSKLKLVVCVNLHLKQNLPLSLLQNALLSILPYTPALEIRVRLDRLPLLLN